MPDDTPDAVPTDSPVFCIAPWTHLHVVPDGLVYPCCMSAHRTSHAIGDLRAGDSLASAWNSTPMRALRRRMLRGERSPHCERCYANEAAGLESWRQAENRELAAHLPLVERTEATGYLDRLNLPYLDIRSSNVCNLKCRICTPSLSSNWHADAVQLGLVTAGTPAIRTATRDPQTLFHEVAPLLPTVERLHFAGGEPLLSDDHYAVLSRLVANRQEGTRLSYNTNLSRLTYRHHDVIRMWQQFRHVYVQASLDGMDQRGDYMRRGQHWPQVVANRKRMLAECPHVQFDVLATVSLMNALHLPDFFRALLDQGLIGVGQFQVNLLFEPTFYDVRGLSRRLKDQVVRAYDDLLAELPPSDPGSTRAATQFRAVLTHMLAADYDVGEAFRWHTKRLDLLRHESCAEIFPELAEMTMPETPADLLVSARAKGSIGRVTEALADLELAIAQARPERGDLERETAREAYLLRASVSRALGNVTGVERDLRAALALDTTRGTRDVSSLPVRASTDGNARLDVDATLAECIAKLQNGEVHLALTLAARAAEDDPLRMIALVAARWTREAGVPDVTSHDDAGALTHLMANPALGLFVRGLAFRAAGDEPQARADFDRVLELQPLVELARIARHEHT